MSDTPIIITESPVFRIELSQGGGSGSGMPGPPGPAGAPGEMGAPGPAGQDGEQGPQGIQGPPGEPGLQGIQGPKGDKGDAGTQGIQGIQGPAGSDGAKGDKGDPGIQGPQGEMGPQGIQGPAGPKGDTGADGPQGIQGPQGEPGPAGTGGSAGPVVRYVHSGNDVIQPTSWDVETGIWTAAGGGILASVGAAGASKPCIPVCSSWANNSVPREMPSGSSFRIEAITDTTFYVQNGTTRITSYPNGANASVDVSRIRFEVNAPNSVNIDISSLGLQEMIIRGSGNRERAGQTYIRLHGTSAEGDLFGIGNAIADGKAFHTVNVEQYYKYDPVNEYILIQALRSAQRYWQDSNGTWAIFSSQEMATRYMERRTDVQFTHINVLLMVANGFTIDVYDLQGGTP